MPAKPIDEYLGLPKGSFIKFMKAQERLERWHEIRRQKRIKNYFKNRRLTN